MPDGACPPDIAKQVALVAILGTIQHTQGLEYNWSMEPVSTITAAFSLVKAAGDIGKSLSALRKNLKDHDIKQQIEEILDRLHELKQSAAGLEDENRELREKLRFKGDVYEFRSPFWYEKLNPQQALCPKCFAHNIAAPMDLPGRGCDPAFRSSLACQTSLHS